MAMVCLVLSLLATVVAGKRTVVIDQDIQAKADKAHETSKCDAEDHGKVDCGFVGVTQDMCEGIGCCWKPSTPGGGTPWCFFDKNTVSEVRTARVIAGSDGNRGHGAGLYVMIRPAGSDGYKCEEHDSSDPTTKEEKSQELTPQCTWFGLQQTNTKGVAKFNVPESCGLGPFMAAVYPEGCSPVEQRDDCEALEQEICLNFPLDEALVGRTVYEEGTIDLDATKTRLCEADLYEEGISTWTAVAECLKTNCKNLQHGTHCQSLNQFGIAHCSTPFDIDMVGYGRYRDVDIEKEKLLFFRRVPQEVWHVLKWLFLRR